MNEYNNPSFATIFQCALLNTLLHAQQDALTQYKDTTWMLGLEGN
jgi:hypothetical protein